MTPQIDQSQLQRFVMAGQRLMYDKSTRQYFINGLKREGEKTDILAQETVALLKMLDEKAKGKIPRQILPMVGVALLVEAAHFAAEAGIFVTEKENVAVAAKKAIDLILKVFGSKQAPAAEPQPAAQPAAPPAPAGVIQSAQGV